MVWELCREYPDKIVVSIDAHEDEEIATRGWTENSGRYLEEVLIEMSSAGAVAFTVAEVGRDALEDPPNYEALRRAQAMGPDYYQRMLIADLLQDLERDQCGALEQVQIDSSGLLLDRNEYDSQ